MADNESEGDRTIVLISQDGQTFEVDEKVANLSNFIKTILEGVHQSWRNGYPKISPEL